MTWWREGLRVLFLIEIFAQPVLVTWLVIIALRIHRDQQQMQVFLNTWGDRKVTLTDVLTKTPEEGKP